MAGAVKFGVRELALAFIGRTLCVSGFGSPTCGERSRTMDSTGVLKSDPNGSAGRALCGPDASADRGSPRPITCPGEPGGNKAAASRPPYEAKKKPWAPNPALWRRRLPATFAKSRIELSHGKQKPSQIPDRNKIGVFEIRTNATADPLPPSADGAAGFGMTTWGKGPDRLRQGYGGPAGSRGLPPAHAKMVLPLLLLKIFQRHTFPIQTIGTQRPRQGSACSPFRLAGNP
jgi:hypothetical protein